MFISRIANRPRGGTSLKGSTTINFRGSMTTMAASPCLIPFGLTSIVFPVFRSTVSRISTNFAARLFSPVFIESDLDCSYQGMLQCDRRNMDNNRHEGFQDD